MSNQENTTTVRPVDWSEFEEVYGNDPNVLLHLPHENGDGSICEEISVPRGSRVQAVLTDAGFGFRYGWIKDHGHVSQSRWVTYWRRVWR